MSKHKTVAGIQVSSAYFFAAYICVLVWLCCMYVPCAGQTFTLIKEVNINKPVALSTDRYSNILIGDTKGNIYKLDAAGTITHDYSPQTIAAITSIEAWPTLQTFVFYKDIQAFTILNRFLVPLPGYPVQLANQQIGFARAATMAADENIWLFDDMDFSLKKFNIRSQNITLHTPLELILYETAYQINFMREYHNMLYINDKNSGILVFDNLGNYKKRIPVPQLDFFSFHNNELYFLQQGKVHFINLYTFAQRDIPLPVQQLVKYAIFSEEVLFLLTEKSILIYKLF